MSGACAMQACSWASDNADWLWPTLTMGCFFILALINSNRRWP